ncbi:myb-like protein D [Gossypium australe]|uniref:Myb-like protein D n=1 Tax=Gossypium australe TaxID=47621 RepID=A0A5B6VXS1_9ROSI|nr:myb-like protein D [Gossypium australe]
MTKDLNQHLKWFLQLCDTFKYNEVTNDVIRLRLFPFSLFYNAFSWLDSQAPGSITTWDDLAGKFLQKFFPISKALEGESFHEAWESFKILVQKCPHHGFPEWIRL